MDEIVAAIKGRVWEGVHLGFPLQNPRIDPKTCEIETEPVLHQYELICHPHTISIIMGPFLIN